MRMTDGNMIRARYISDEIYGDFEKGKVYEHLFWPKDDSRKIVICFIDQEGEEYGISADHFEILEDNTPDDWWKGRIRTV